MDPTWTCTARCLDPATQEIVTCGAHNAVAGLYQSDSVLHTPNQQLTEREARCWRCGTVHVFPRNPFWPGGKPPWHAKGQDP